MTYIVTQCTQKVKMVYNRMKLHSKRLLVGQLGFIFVDTPLLGGVPKSVAGVSHATLGCEGRCFVFMGSSLVGVTLGSVPT
jgi:hypothetical protein